MIVNSALSYDCVDNDDIDGVYTLPVMIMVITTPILIFNFR
jgi:hypothetical protein